MADNNFFSKMCKEAMDEVASGDKGWKDAPTNVLLLACFGMLQNHLTHKLVRPLWFFASSVFVGVVAYLVTLVLGG